MTMNNYFELLNISPAPRIDLVLLDDHYKASAADAHPDQGGSKEEFDLLNIAKKTLLNPSSRIKHILEIHSITYEKRGAVSNHLMNHFMSTGELIQRADAFIKKKLQTTSALTKALLENDSVEMQEKISLQIDQLEIAQVETLNSLPTEMNSQVYEVAARDLAFLEKWQAQLKERYGLLF